MTRISPVRRGAALLATLAAGLAGGLVVTGAGEATAPDARACR